MEFLLQPKQAELARELIAGRATWLGYGGSRGGAKSHGLRCALLACAQHAAASRKPIRLAILRRTWPQLRDNHVEKFRELLPKLFPQGWHAQDRELHLPGGSVLEFRYAESEADVLGMLGKEYAVLAVDQAEMFSEKELLILKSLCRSPGHRAKILLAFNPGGLGHAFLKRIFWDKEYRNGEMQDDYHFIQAFGWDNVEWSAGALREDGVPPEIYYSWPEKRRYEYFITRSDYGRQLNALPEALRLGWLLGLMDKFAGQFFDCFNPELHVGRRPIDEWRERWLGIDWGFAHNSVCYWIVNLGDVFYAYREFAAAGRSPAALAQEIADRTPLTERGQVRQVWLSHDAFGQRDEREPIARQMGRVFTASGLPHPRSATRDLIASSTAMYEIIRTGKLLLDPGCKEAIKAMPMIARDEDRPERPVKFEGDDAFDALRYGLYGRGAETPGDAQAELRKKIQAEESDPLRRWQRLTKLARPKSRNAPIAPNYIPAWQKIR